MQPRVTSVDQEYFPGRKRRVISVLTTSEEIIKIRSSLEHVLIETGYKQTVAVRIEALPELIKALKKIQVGQSLSGKAK